jgi:hypothetical protein
VISGACITDPGGAFISVCNRPIAVLEFCDKFKRPLRNRLRIETVMNLTVICNGHPPTANGHGF